MNEQQQRMLIEGLAALSASTRQMSARPQVEAAVLAEMTRSTRRALDTLSPSRRNGGAWLAIAATLTLACASGIWVVQRTAGSVETDMQAGGFLAIPAAAYLPPMESGAIVRVELPLSALPSYGIQIAPEMHTDSVNADLLVAQDGLARGIRIVNSHNSRSTP